MRNHPPGKPIEGQFSAHKFDTSVCAFLDKNQKQLNIVLYYPNETPPICLSEKGVHEDTAR